MSTERISIKNRHRLKLVVQIDISAKPTNLVFIEPGQGGFIEQKHITTFAEAFLENDFRVVRFDPTHSLGKSEGDIKDVTYTSYTEDLEDVINWAKTQSWFQKPFALAGHSLGGTTTAWYAEHHSDEVFCVAPLSLVPNHDLYIQTLDPQFKKDWQEKGYYESQSRSKPGTVKQIGYGVVESLINYDVLKNADKLTMPVLLMAGSEDTSTPYEHQQMLFDKIPGQNKKLIKIEGVEHSFRNSQTGEYDEKLDEVKQAISDWLKTVVV